MAKPAKKQQTIQSVCVHRRKGHAVQIGIKDGWQGIAIHYRLDVPLDGHKDVIVSAVHKDYGMGSIVHETYIFPCDERGNVISFAELEGSERDITDHAKVLANVNIHLAPTAKLYQLLIKA